jgi:hypothetical protein
MGHFSSQSSFQRIVGCICAFLVLFLQLSQSVAYADEAEDGAATAGAAIITRQGAPAPFPGVLYRIEVDAARRAEQQAKIERMENKHQLDMSLLRLRLQYATSTTAAALDAEKKAHVASQERNDRIMGELGARLGQVEQENHELRDGAEFHRWLNIGLGVALVIAAAGCLKLVADR